MPGTAVRYPGFGHRKEMSQTQMEKKAKNWVIKLLSTEVYRDIAEFEEKIADFLNKHL
jgi:hypothetical protein